jgi:hypothetical protein
MLNHSIIATNISEELLLPETSLEEQLLLTPEFSKGLYWGTPRYGHPEGAVIYHIVEVLENIERLMLTPIERETLRLVALVHDTFKFKEEQLRVWNDDYSQHHGLLARQFMEQYTDNESVLKLIELHDEAYYIWKMQDEKRRQTLIERLFYKLGDDLQLFYTFFLCDTKTGDKTQTPISWFESSAKGMIKFIRL